MTDDRKLAVSTPIVLRVDYDDADDLLADFTANLSMGGTCVAGSRMLPEGADVHLAIGFPGLAEPIFVAGVVKWWRAAEQGSTADPTICIDFVDVLQREHLARTIARIRDRDPKLVKRPLRVLIVEDNPHVGNLISHALGDRGPRGLGPRFAVDCRLVFDGREALDQLRDHKFDAAIIDVYLPSVDGVSVIAAARGQLDQPGLPIMAVSAGGDAAHRAAMSAGATIFIDKPVRLRSVIETMRFLMKLDEET